MPIVRNYHGVRSFQQMEINEAAPWREKICKTLRTFYGKTPFFKECFPLCEPLILNPTSSLLSYNVQAIKGILDILQRKKDSLRMASEFAVSSQGTQRLIDLVKAVAGNTYLAGAGAGGYQEDHLFAEQGVNLLYQNFCHPVYAQTGQEFVPGLSILDALFHAGVEQTRKWLTQPAKCFPYQMFSRRE